MAKVLIISAPFFDYQVSVGRAFRKLGYDVHIETYDEPIHPFKGLLKWRHKFSPRKEQLRQASRLKYKQYIEKVFSEYKPDIVFIYNGTILLDSTLDFFREHGAKVLLWMYDSVQRPDRAMCVSHIDHVDVFCCFEQTDVDFYQRQGKTAYFLPLACDTDVYYPIANQEKDIDILFVGTIYTSPKRIKVLEQVAEHYKGKGVLFYGHYKPFYKNPLTWLCRKYRDVFLNVNLPPKEVNELFSRTKIALNVHHSQTFNGANQRLFEACGAGAYQICDSNPFIESIFSNSEVGLYNSIDELYERIDYALSHDMSDKAEAAYKIIIEKHTFIQRVEQMLSYL